MNISIIAIHLYNYCVMLEISDKDFEELVNKALDSLPQLYLDNLNNVAIVTADQPTPEQRIELKLRCNDTLFGLYQGIPLTKRGSNYSLVIPDKITIFKLPILSVSRTLADVAEQVRHTVWHEVAHFYGLDHEQIHKLEK